MNPVQMYNLTDVTRTISHKFVGSKLKGERLYDSVKMKGTKFTGQLRGRAKHWLVIDANLPNPDFVVPDFPIERAEYTGSTLLFIDLSKIDSDASMTLQWSQNNAFLPIHILGTRKPSTDHERPTKRRRIGNVNNHQPVRQALPDPYETLSLVTTPRPSSYTIQHINPLSTLLYASNTSYQSNPSSTVVDSNTNVVSASTQNNVQDESSDSSVKDYDDDTRALKLLAQALDDLKSPDAKKRAKCLERMHWDVIWRRLELIKSNPILADTICKCIITGLQDKDLETRKWAVSCLTEADGAIGPALQEYHEDILPLVIEALVVSPVESSKIYALFAASSYLHTVPVPSLVIEEHFDALMTNLIRTISEPVEWDEGQRFDYLRYLVFDVILILIKKYPQLNFDKYIYKLLPHIKMALDEDGPLHFLKAAKKLIRKLLKPIASTALELCSLVLEATKEEESTDIEDQFKSSMMNVLNRSTLSEHDFSESDSDSYSDS